MRSVFLALAAAGLIVGAANAQYGTAGSAAGSAGKAATGAAESAGKAAEKGAAAVFTTEGQAKNKIEASGYSNVTGLSKDSQGIWHGKAQKDGMPVNISLDTQGNVKAE